MLLKFSFIYLLNISGFLESVNILLYKFSMFIIKWLYIFFLSFLLVSCTLNKIDKVHGVSNLNSKLKLIKINRSNKNDIVKILGPVLVKDKDENRWTYFEIREAKTKYGKRNIYLNDYVEIYFNKYNVVNKIDIYNLNNMNQYKFVKNKTKTLGVKDTFSKNLLNSTRKRMENARKKFDK